jgi:hypothetical protein
VPRDSLTIEQILIMLAETPSRIAALAADLTPVQLCAKPNPDEWSANDVLAHLRSCADMWGNCIEVILAQDKPTIRAINPRTWINSTDYPQQEFQPSLRSFAKQRTALLKVLEPLKPKDWSRTATVTGRVSHSYGPCTRTHSGWRAMNGRTSSRLHASLTRCAHSNSHPLSRRHPSRDFRGTLSTGMKQGGTRWTKSIYIRA